MEGGDGRSPYNSQKKFSKYNKQTVDSLRSEIRTEFKNRLQVQREKQRDSQRNFSEETLKTLVEQSGEHIKNMVISNEPEDINSMLNLIAEVEQEILTEEQNVLRNIYERDLELEVNNSLPKCVSCQKLINLDIISHESFICGECSADFVNS
nr:uncharacterized protein LOC111414239 [Onthophagus taurus]